MGSHPAMAGKHRTDAFERRLNAIIAPFHNRNLNDVPPFREGVINPSAENVSLHIGRLLVRELPAGVRLTRVEVWETSTNRATYIP